jgi:hypothetical protein
LVRIPGGTAWVAQYTDVGVKGFLFFAALNALVWGSIVAISSLYRRPIALVFPCLLGFGFLACAHYTLDLSSDPQAALALAYIPIYALPFVAVGSVIGYLVDRRLRRNDAA